MPEPIVRVPEKRLRDFTQRVFERCGLPKEDAAIEADALLWANLRGIDSHGVLRVLPYVERAKNGNMNPKPNVKVLKETPSVLMVDADRAFGPVITVWAMRKAIEKAKNVGIGWCLLRNVTHQGALGYYTQMAAREGMMGIAIVCSPPNMAPYQAKAAGVHNSPISISAPAKRHRPLILDMATSVAAGGKLDLAIDKGVPIPTTWALDAQGVSTTDPKLARILLPAGGYKGSGLAMMFECMTGIMAANSFQVEVLSGRLPGGGRATPGRGLSLVQNGVVAALDISLFTDLEKYKETVDSYIDGLKALPAAEGFSEVLVPGEPEDRTEDDRRKNGIPLPMGTLRNLKKVAEDLELDFPFKAETK